MNINCDLHFLPLTQTKCPNRNTDRYRHSYVKQPITINAPKQIGMHRKPFKQPLTKNTMTNRYYYMCSNPLPKVLPWNVYRYHKQEYRNHNISKIQKVSHYSIKYVYSNTEGVKVSLCFYLGGSLLIAPPFNHQNRHHIISSNL